MGLDIFSKQRSKRYLIIRAVFIFASLFLIAALFFTSLDSENDFIDKLLKSMYNLGGVVVIIQIVVFLKNTSKILDLSIWLKDSYNERDSMIVRRYSKDRLMERYKTITVNLLK